MAETGTPPDAPTRRALALENQDTRIRQEPR
jgi:hypothetical protein